MRFRDDNDGVGIRDFDLRRVAPGTTDMRFDLKSNLDTLGAERIDTENAVGAHMIVAEDGRAATLMLLDVSRRLGKVAVWTALTPVTLCMRTGLPRLKLQAVGQRLRHRRAIGAGIDEKLVGPALGHDDGNGHSLVPVILERDVFGLRTLSMAGRSLALSKQRPLRRLPGLACRMKMAVNRSLAGVRIGVAPAGTVTALAERGKRAETGPLLKLLSTNR